MKFGALTVIKRVGPKAKHIQWLCRCDCKNEHTVLGHNLRNGSVKSCGCQAHPKTHGMTGSRLYQVWASMHARCNSPSYHARKHYAEKGIAVCAEWSNFEPFRDWALANGYEDDLTLDREKNDKGYQPDNCRFITIAEQQQNKTNHTLLTHGGKTQPLYRWAQELGLKETTICNRLARGWPVERALSEPIRRF
jgi:hypothetical protein